MPLELVESRPGFREFRFTGPLRIEDLRELRSHDFTEDERPARAIIDLTQMEATGLPLDQLAYEVNFRRDEESPPLLAIVTTSSFTFGRVQQLIQYQGVGHRIRVFSERDAAVAWLDATHSAANGGE